VRCTVGRVVAFAGDLLLLCNTVLYYRDTGHKVDPVLKLLRDTGHKVDPVFKATERHWAQGDPVFKAIEGHWLTS
jgi:hypothetical protein